MLKRIEFKKKQEIKVPDLIVRYTFDSVEELNEMIAYYGSRAAMMNAQKKFRKCVVEVK